MIARRLLSVIALSTMLLVLPATSLAFPTTNMPYCDLAITTNCIVSASVDTAPVTDVDPTYNVTASRWNLPGGGPTNYFEVMVDLDVGGFAINPAQVWEVTINTGSVRALQTNGRGQNVTVTRGGDASSGYLLTFLMSSVAMSYTDSGCAGTGTCPAAADYDVTGAWQADANDALFVTNLAERASYNGFDFYNSSDWSSIPPQLNTDTNTIYVDVSNSHFKVDGVTPFYGHTEFVLPNAMLSYLYNVDDPASVTAGSFAVTTGGGSPTTTVTILPGGVKVVIDNLSYSKHRLKIVGKTTPGRPKNLKARRTSSNMASIRTTGAKSRGSKVLGYDAICKSRVGKVHAWTKRTRKLPVRLTGLRRGYGYSCIVRARSRAGLGLASKVHIKATP